jgi:hypothetical protein
MGTATESFIELTERIGRKTGGVSVYPFTSAKRGQDAPVAKLIVSSLGRTVVGVRLLIGCCGLQPGGQMGCHATEWPSSFELTLQGGVRGKEAAECVLGVIMGCLSCGVIYQRQPQQLLHAAVLEHLAAPAIPDVYGTLHAVWVDTPIALRSTTPFLLTWVSPLLCSPHAPPGAGQGHGGQEW